MGMSTTLNHTAITIDPLLLDECLRIWRVSKTSLPPSPYEVAMMDVARLEVVTWAEIVRFYEDEDQRKSKGYA